MHSFNEGNQHDADQARREAVVVEVEPSLEKAHVEHHRSVEHSGHYTPFPAELAGDGGQAGAEQGGQHHAGLLQAVDGEAGGDDHPGHHRQAVPGMLAESGKAADGEQPADGGAVEPAADGQQIHQADQAHDAHIDQSGTQAVQHHKIGDQPAGMAAQLEIGLERGGVFDAHRQDAEKNPRQPGGQQPVVALAPVQPGGEFVAEALAHRGEHKADQPCRKAYII